MTKSTFLSHKELIYKLLENYPSLKHIIVKTKNKDDFTNYNYFCRNGNGDVSIANILDSPYSIQIFVDIWSGPEQVEFYLKDGSSYFYRQFDLGAPLYTPIILNNTNAIWKF